jgi:hypothetical protein
MMEIFRALAGRRCFLVILVAVPDNAKPLSSILPLAASIFSAQGSAIRVFRMS